MRSNNLRRGAAAAAVATTICGVGTALAGGPPTSRDALATIELVHEPSGDTVRKCFGANGDEYHDIRSGAVGTVTSPDPRLAGELTTSERVMVNRTTLQGTITGEATLRDPASGATKMRGKLYAVLKGTAVAGVLVGTMSDGDLIIANASLVHDPNTTTTHGLRGTLGGPSAVPIDLALIQTRRCPGED